MYLEIWKGRQKPDEKDEEQKKAFIQIQSVLLLRFSTQIPKRGYGSILGPGTILRYSNISGDPERGPWPGA